MLRSSWMIFILAAPVSAQGNPSWDRDVEPILRKNCFHCHGDKEKKSQLDLRTVEGLLKGGKTGASLRPGSLRESLLWQFVATDKMPAVETKLTEAEKDVIRRWIVAGTPKNSATVQKDKSNFSVAKVEKRGVPALAKRIDEEIGARLQQEKIPSSPLCTDAEFLRRVYLDLTGKVPTYAQTVAFLESKDPQKRARLIEELLASPDYGKHFATLWHNLLIAETAETYRNLPHDKFKAWLAEGFNQGRGWDRMVQDLLAAVGPVPEPPRPGMKKSAEPEKPEGTYLYSFMLDKRIQPKLITANASRLFLAQSIECAQCHNHPQSKWKRSDFWGMAAFFDRIRVEGKQRSLVEPASGKEIVMEQKNADRKYVIPAIQPKPVIDMEDGTEKRTGKFVPAKFLDDELLDPETPGPFRPIFAKWATAPENPFFARAAVNRWWDILMSRGFVEPLDDMSEDNQPSHPLLLQELAGELAASGFDLKHLIRCICHSQTYQRSSIPLKENQADRALFSHQSPRQMTAEVLFDSLCIVVPGFNAEPEKKSKNFDPEKFRNEFLVVFDGGDGSPSEFSRGLQQALRLMNGDGKLFGPAALKTILNEGASVDENLDRIYLTVLNRRPSDRERRQMQNYVGPTGAPDRLADVFWALLNCGEFIINH